MSKRLIYVDDAIDALNTLFKKQVTQFGYEGYEKADEKTQLVCDGISESIGCLLNLSTAQPELIEKAAYIRGFEQGKTQGMIDAKLELTCNQLATDCITAQPEIIRCRECKHMQEDKIFHQCWCNGNEVKFDDYCSYAERRTDGVDS